MGDAVVALLESAAVDAGGDAASEALRALWRVGRRERRWHSRHAPLTGLEAVGGAGDGTSREPAPVRERALVERLDAADRLVLEIRYLRHPRPSDAECRSEVGVGWSAIEKRAAVVSRRLRKAARAVP